MKGKDRDLIAQKYKIPDGHIFSSWLRSLNHLRNLCAHHTRLWNRNMVDQAVLPSKGDAGELSHFIGQPHLLARPFLYLCILQWLMKEICPNSSWGDRMKEHMLSFPTDANNLCSLSNMGCPKGWETWKLWQR
jgi:abortive infection bacteriophage resistance protein